MQLEEKLDDLKNFISKTNGDWKEVESKLKERLSIKSRQEIKALGMGMEVIHYTEKYSGGINELNEWTEKYINSPRNGEISNIECDFCAHSNVGVGRIKYRNNTSFFGLINRDTKQEYLLGVRTEEGGEKYLFLDLGLEFGTSHWVPADKSPSELREFLKKLIDKGIISECEYNLITMVLPTDSNENYFKDVVIDTSDNLNSVDNVILSIEGFEEDIKLKLTYENMKSAIILASELDDFLKSVNEYGRLIFELPILARKFGAYYIFGGEYLDSFINLYGGGKLYINSLENLNAAEFYIKNENLGFQKIDVELKYEIKSSTGRASREFKSLNGFYSVLDQATRWTGINLNVAIKNDEQGCYLFSTSKLEPSVKQIFGE